MHEFSIAQSIVETVIQTARVHGARRVLAVNLEAGEVALVNVEQLGWHIGMLTQGSVAQGMQLNWRRIPVRIQCLECGYEGAVRYEETDPSAHLSVPTFECPRCEAAQTRITAGRELRIVDIHASFDDEEGGEDHA